jgi:hypothetical protein
MLLENGITRFYNNLRAGEGSWDISSMQFHLVLEGQTPSELSRM